MSSKIVVDYLVIGAGAMGLAFADALVAESEYTVAIVDRNHAPGGHWTFSYPFVRLHGSSKFYGVNSRPMVSDARRGANLASRHEILDYYDTVVNDVLVPSGRVRFLPSHEIHSIEYGEPSTASARSVLTGVDTVIEVTRRIVDASYLHNTVPAMGSTRFAVDPEVSFMPINGLASIESPPERVTVIGSGKTGLDACLWLLNRGMDPDRITWIAPRESWLVSRDSIWFGTQIGGLMSLIDKPSLSAIAHDIEDRGGLYRVHPDVEPTGFRCATVSAVELELLRAVTDVVRLGHVRRISPTRVELDDGDIEAAPKTLYVDCTADGLALAPLKPVFQPGLITLQALLPCLVPVSGGLTAHLEVVGGSDEEKNSLAVPVQNPHAAIDLLAFIATRLGRLMEWTASPLVNDWLRTTRMGTSLWGYDEIEDPVIRSQAHALIGHLDELIAAAR